MFKKRLIFLAILLIALVSISVASAAEDVTSNIADSTDDVSLEEISDEEASVEDSNSDLLGSIDEDEKLSDTPKSFTELNETIDGNSYVSLDSDYTYTDDDSAFEHGINLTHDLTINGNGHTIDGNGKARIFMLENKVTVVFENIIFVNAQTPGPFGHGGAIWVNDGSKATAENCTFKDNKATYLGGATHGDCTAFNCTFIGNRADGWKDQKNGGAMNRGTAINCTFICNEAGKNGGAVCNATAINCTFICNSAPSGPHEYATIHENCIFIDSAKIRASDFTTIYNSSEKLLFDFVAIGPDEEIIFDNMNFTIKITQDDEEIGTYNALSGKDNGWIVDLEPGVYNATLSFKNLEPVTVKIVVQIGTEITAEDVTTTYNVDKDLVITLTDKQGNPISDAEVSVDLGEAKTYTTDENGQIKIAIGKLVPKTYNAKISFEGNEYQLESEATSIVVVDKAPSKVTTKDVTTTYNVDKDFVITLTDGEGNPLSGAEVSVDLGGTKTYTTDENGQIKIAIGKLTPKTYNAKISFKGDEYYLESETTAKVVVKKATPKITASAKTFTFEDKTKKYTVTLKDNKGNALKNAKVTLKVNGKTYTATTNSKGVATFKLSDITKGKKLTKKATYSAVITYAGDKYYNKVTKKVKLSVKAYAWKTVAKGNKNKTMVKKIQRALKKNGFYIRYKGRNLLVDGLYHKYTEMAVKEFQRAKKLKVTGKVDEATAKKLKIY